MLDTLLADNVQAWALGPDGTWERLREGRAPAGDARDSDAAIGQTWPASPGLAARPLFGPRRCLQTDSFRSPDAHPSFTSPSLDQPTWGEECDRGARRRHRHRVQHRPPPRRRTYRGLVDQLCPRGACAPRSRRRDRAVRLHLRAQAPGGGRAGTGLHAPHVSSAAARSRSSSPRPAVRARTPASSDPRSSARPELRSGVLSAKAEGRLAYEGAVAQAGELPARVTVCDVGGGSTEVVAGTTGGGPRTCRCLEVGSLRLTRRFLDDDPPGKKAVRAARREVARHFEGLDLPGTDIALATGGSARSLRRLTGRRRLHADELGSAVRGDRKDALAPARSEPRPRSRARADAPCRGDHPRRGPAAGRRAPGGGARRPARRRGLRAPCGTGRGVAPPLPPSP